MDKTDIEDFFTPYLINAGPINELPELAQVPKKASNGQFDQLLQFEGRATLFPPRTIEGF